MFLISNVLNIQIPFIFWTVFTAVHTLQLCEHFAGSLDTYTYLANSYASGSLINVHDTLLEAKSACSANSECKVIMDLNSETGLKLFYTSTCTQLHVHNHTGAPCTYRTVNWADSWVKDAKGQCV